MVAQVLGPVKAGESQIAGLTSGRQNYEMASGRFRA